MDQVARLGYVPSQQMRMVVSTFNSSGTLANSSLSLTVFC
jgi:hypothetical protein